jgi:hypothetical protein
VNIFHLVVDLLDLVHEMNTQLAAHVHPGPTNAAAFAADAAKAVLLPAMLGSVTR